LLIDVLSTRFTSGRHVTDSSYFVAMVRSFDFLDLYLGPGGGSELDLLRYFSGLDRNAVRLTRREHLLSSLLYSIHNTS